MPGSNDSNAMPRPPIVGGKRGGRTGGKRTGAVRKLSLGPPRASFYRRGRSRSTFQRSRVKSFGVTYFSPARQPDGGGERGSAST